MKLIWKNKNNKRPLSANPNLPFDEIDDDTSKKNKLASKDSDGENDDVSSKNRTSDDEEIAVVAESFRTHGNKLAEEGKYREALGKWESALNLTPSKAILHEQKAQVLLEIGDTWNGLKAATRATELEPSWSEAWITLGRAQLNYGEPDSALQSFEKALSIKSDLVEGREGRQTAIQLVKKREQLQSSGLSSSENRFVVGEKDQNASSAH